MGTKSILEANVPIPAVNQFEFQPYWHKADWVAYNQQHNIVVTGAAPLGGPDVAPFRDNWNSSILQLPAVTTIASTHNCTPAQVILSWEYNNHGVVVNPRTNHTQHMKDNLAPWWDQCRLSDQEVAIMDSLQDVPPPGATSMKVYHAGICS